MSDEHEEGAPDRRRGDATAPSREVDTSDPGGRSHDAPSDDSWDDDSEAIPLYSGELNALVAEAEDDAPPEHAFLPIVSAEFSIPAFTEGTAVDAAHAPWDRGERDAADWQERVIELEVELAVTDEPAQRVTLLITIAAIQRDELRDLDAAAETLERALQLDGTHDGALAQFERVHQDLGQPERLLERLLELAEGCDGAGRATLLRAVARSYEQAGEAEKAAIVLDAAREADPENISVVRALERVRALEEDSSPEAVLLEPPPRPPEPLELLQQQLQVSRAIEDRVEIYEQMAALWIRRSELSRAIDCLEQILLLDPDHERALLRLQEIHHHAGNLEALADVLERHIDVAPKEEVAALCRRLAHLCEGSLKDPERGRRAYERLLGIEPGSPLVLRSIARLSEEAGDWHGLVDALRQLADVMPKPTEQADCLYRIGWVCETRLNDPDLAEVNYQRCLESNPGHADALERAVEIWQARGDWAKAVRQLLRSEQAMQSAGERARLLCQAAGATLEHLADEATATELYERAMSVDPSNGEAAEALAERYELTGDDEGMLRVVEVLLRRVGGRDPVRRRRLLLQCAESCSALGRDEEAAGYYRDVLELEPEHLLALQRLAELAQKAGNHAEAYETARRVLLLRSVATDEDRLRSLEVLARAALKLGKRARAAEAYRQAQMIDPSNRTVNEQLAELQAEAGNWQGAFEAKQALLAQAEDAEQRRSLLVECGDLLWRQLGRAEDAERAYIQALDLDPDSHVVLHRLLDLYSESKAWASAVAICRRLAEVESDKALRARYLAAGGLICRDELGQFEPAIDLLNRALDEDASHLKAFEAIDKLCTSRRDWKRLEHAYGRMLQRLPQDGELALKVTLWHNLGEILRTRRRDFESAVAAFEAADRLEPGNLQRRDILAELYLTLGPSYAPQAIATLHKVVRDKPHRFNAYHQLFRLYRLAGQRDRAWCVAATLGFLRRAERDEGRYYKRYQALRRAAGRLTEQLLRRHVAHPELDPAVCMIFGALAKAVAPIWARSHADFGLRRKDRRDLAVDQVLFSRIFVYAAEVLGVPPADVHFRPDVPAGMLMAHTVEAPSFVVGSHLLEGRSEKELVFAIGRQLTFVRPELFLRNALTTRSHLQIVLLAAIKLCSADFQVPLGEEQAVEQMLAHLRKVPMHPAQLETLATVVKRLNSTGLDITRWWNASDLTADRVGLLLCNDPTVAAGMIGAEAESGLPMRDRLAHLVRYAASEDYFAAREALGIAVPPRS